MALKGTLTDFGIAEILQLIGQQQKTGTLALKAKGKEVRVGFRDGAIVKAESTQRKKPELIGAMLVRAGLVTEEQLEVALETQKTKVKKLGDVLVESGILTQAKFQELVRLQTTETLYQLFHWKTGTYEFIQGEFEYDDLGMTPLRADAILMDGFRMMDEWPMVRKRLPPPFTVFDRVKPLPLDESGGDDEAAETQGIGPHERRIYGLVIPGRDLQSLIDRSCIGEFETCKAAVTLLNLGYIKIVSSPIKTVTQRPTKPIWDRLKDFQTRVVTPVLALVGLAYVGSWVPNIHMNTLNSPSRFSDPAAQRFIGTQQLSRIETAVEIYRTERGDFPKTLDSLVEAGLLDKTDINYPWTDRYHYRPAGEGQFVLLPPLR